MIGSMLAHIVEGLFQPRASIERLMAARPTVLDAALMAVLSYCLQAILITLWPGTGSGAPGGEATGIPAHLGWMLFTVAEVFIIGFMIHGIGRLFGGVATREQALAVAAWHQLVIVLLLPLILIAASEFEEGQPPGLWPSLLVVFAAAQIVWLLARYVAAVHRFRSDWTVLGVIVGIAMLVSTLVLMLRGG